MLHKYSLADHTLTITLPTSNLIPGISGTQIILGGPGQNGESGSLSGNISIARTNNTWDTEGDRTGSWVHNQNLDKTGAISIQLRQISDDVVKMISIFKIYQSARDLPAQGFSISVQSTASGNSNVVATGEDCVIAKLPNIDFGDTAQMLDFSFNCGRVTF